MRGLGRFNYFMAGLAVCAALAAVAAALAQAPSTLPPPEGLGQSFRPPPGALIAPGKAPDLTLLHTGDLLGYVDTCGCPKNPAGGLSRRTWVIRQLHSVYPDTPQVLFDSGNFSDNPTPAGEIKTRALVEAMGKLGYAAVNVGERELMMGHAKFLSRTEGAQFPFISTNIVRQDSKEPVFKPFHVVEVPRGGGKPPVRVGVLGVVRFNALFLKTGPDKSNLVIASPKEMVKRYLPEVRRRSDVVVLLGALPEDDARLLARDLPGIDFVLGAYGGKVTTEETKEGETRLVYVGNQGKDLGEERVFLGDNGKPATIVTYVHELSARYPDDEPMKQFMNEVASRVNEARVDDRRKGEEASADAAAHPFAGADTCKGCHTPEHAQWAETAHARALTTLANAKKDEDFACLTCHVTGAGAEGGFRSAQETPQLASVTCEGCHGPGAAHAARPARGYGKIEIASCIGCHNRENSPKFDYYVYLPKVSHGGGARTAR